MPGNKKHDLIQISVRIRKDQKEKIDKARENDWDVTQDSIVGDGLDLYFERKDKK